MRAMMQYADEIVRSSPTGYRATLTPSYQVRPVRCVGGGEEAVLRAAVMRTGASNDRNQGDDRLQGRRRDRGALRARKRFHGSRERGRSCNEGGRNRRARLSQGLWTVRKLHT